ncbi:hypothetical protein OG943_41380 [Amycolatopsis sp. NBC_00345]|uniref:hypothetical protein n=1 Tax=Amycolatopsis sp. NBC_00345 TaxID=2975955 RepID=UPI002E26B914
MKPSHVLTVVAVAAAVAGMTTTAANAEPVSSFGYTSEPGASPLSGDAKWAAPADEVDVWEYSGAVKVDAQTADGWDSARVELSAPAGEQLHEGTYTGARYRDQTAEQLDTPGFYVVRGTRAGAVGCSDVYADFTVSRLVRDGGGAITDFDAVFDQRCGAADAPATHGEVHFHR